ncbi:MAG: RHS repeat-associated core domain-containing protein, partial [Bacteroidales bacterium]|nr:RHS repeat-associated core domain-containing protein [Bacteroidales bacterium]
NDSKSVGTYSTTNSKIHSAIAEDAFGFSLGYYSGDYTGIKSGAPSHLSDMSSLTDLATNSPDLYNGNISRMVSSIYDDQGAASSQLTAYKYDQLNRIAQMKTYSTMVSNAWTGTATSNYQTAYSYDANGNISNLSRKDNSGVDMDGLSYTYVSGKNQLSSVSDSKTTASISEDFEGTSNYTYDAIGNLISDSGEEIATIDWTVTGKVKKITRAATSIKADMEFIYDAMGNRVAKIVKPKDASGNLLASSEYTSTYYVRDASGNVMATYSKKNNAAFYLDELSIYGSDRLGMLKVDEKLVDLPNMDFSSSNIDYSNTTGGRYYELSNHLGNVLSVVSDRRIAQVTDGVIGYYTADIVSATDYYPFGMAMNGRSFSSNSYNYGFGGHEKDDELKGEGNSYDMGARIYDTRVGRTLTRDPAKELYPGISPYVYALNTPTNAVDPDGKVVIFINGLWGPAGGVNKPNKDYWGANWVNRMGNHWNDKNTMFFDGSVGGQSNFVNNSYSSYRMVAGHEAGYSNAKTIIDNLSAGETIKYVTNSQGAAFQRGFSNGVQVYINELKVGNLQAQQGAMSNISAIKKQMADFGTSPIISEGMTYEDLQKNLEAQEQKLASLESEYQKLESIKTEIVVDIEPEQETEKDNNAENHYFILSDKSKYNLFEKLFLSIKPVKGATDASKKSDGTSVTKGHHSSYASPEDLPKP